MQNDREDNIRRVKNPLARSLIRFFYKEEAMAKAIHKEDRDPTKSFAAGIYAQAMAGAQQAVLLALEEVDKKACP